MKTRFGVSHRESSDGLESDRRPSHRPSHLCLVTDQEVQILRDALDRGELPEDFKAKLSNLAFGSLTETVLEQSCRTIIDLIMAAESGLFRDITPTQCEHLLRVLAYVRKDNDAIPDYRPDGFFDDQQEVRGAMVELLPLLQKFKAWRLRYQVPRLWTSSPGLPTAR